jgi:hypothetical protein
MDKFSQLSLFFSVKVKPTLPGNLSFGFALVIDSFFGITNYLCVIQFKRNEG